LLFPLRRFPTARSPSTLLEPHPHPHPAPETLSTLCRGDRLSEFFFQSGSPSPLDSFLYCSYSDSIMGLSWDYLEDRKKEEREREKKAREDTRKAFIFLLDETVQAAEDAGLDERKLHLVKGWRSTLKTALGLNEGQ